LQRDRERERKFIFQNPNKQLVNLYINNTDIQWQVARKAKVHQSWPLIALDRRITLIRWSNAYMGGGGAQSVGPKIQDMEWQDMKKQDKV